MKERYLFDEALGHPRRPYHRYQHERKPQTNLPTSSCVYSIMCVCVCNHRVDTAREITSSFILKDVCQLKPLRDQTLVQDERGRVERTCFDDRRSGGETSKNKSKFFLFFNPSTLYCYPILFDADILFREGIYFYLK
jgi:hypothetical protein